METHSSLQRNLRHFLISAFLLVASGWSILRAQPTVTGAYYITVDQQTIEVVFDEALTWTNPGTWLIKIGGAAQPISGPSGKGTNTLKFLKLDGPIEYADVVAGVTVTYNGNGDVSGMTSGLPLAL